MRYARGRFSETAEDILAYLAACRAAGTACALCVVTGVTGGSARAVGTLVAVREDGEMAGYVSHGCIDADLSFQAGEAIRAGQVRSLVYGKNSPFIDLKLPCGGTVEILVDPAPDPEVCARALNRLAGRRPITLCLDAEAGLVDVRPERCETGWRGAVFNAGHAPQFGLWIAGSGPPMLAMVEVARAMDIPVRVMSPDDEAVQTLDVQTFLHLTTPETRIEADLDRWTAVVLVFHDHDWEAGILRWALAHKPFYIGALGSDVTHAKRLATLADLGISATDCDRIVGPIGLIPSTRNARTLAISTLAQIMDSYRLFTGSEGPQEGT